MQPLRRIFHHDNIQTRQIGLLLLITCFLFSGQPGYAIDISDVPMATQIQKAPPNIMFVLDNSGSMNWELMVAGSSEGKWWSERMNRLYTYIFYGNRSPLGPEWQSQWSEVNKIYYNQTSTYVPWPHPDPDIELMPDADMTNPIQNPYDLIHGDNDGSRKNITSLHYFLAPPMPSDIIVVDNLDETGFTTSDPDDWNDSNNTPEWQASTLYSNTDGATATFTPTIVNEDDYDVYAFWNCSSGRDQYPMITITYYDTTTIPPGITSVNIDQSQRSATSNVCDDNCGRWILLGTYHFQPGETGSVAISHHAGSNGSTAADAVLFAPHGTPIPPQGDYIDINFGHYFAGTWDDNNGNGLVDDGADSEIQAAYLVNFQGQDRCGGTPPANPTRQIYEINDINANGILDDSGELTYYGTELPEALRPQNYDDEGLPTGYMNAEEELQNFANWFSYYRRRALAAKAAVGSVIDDAEGIRVGFYSLHDHDAGITRQPVLMVNIPGETDETSTLLWHLYEMNSSGGTPLRSSLRNVGRYFDVADGSADFTDSDGNNVSLGVSPYYDEEEGGACQHAFALVMTDGYWNSDGGFNIGNIDGGMGDPYQDDYENTLADVAMDYYDRDLSSLPNQLPTTDCDLNSRQHMVTFSVSFGLNGTINIEDMNENGTPDVDEDFNGEGGSDGLSYKTDPCFLDDNTPSPAWPAPVANLPSTIDDLWHAAVNGRGEFFSASNPEELITALVAIFEKVQEVNSSEAAFTIDGDVISSNTKVYGPSYDSATWTGEVKAIAFDEDGNLPYDEDGNIPDDEILWKASEELMDLVGEDGVNHTNRKIVTMHDTTGNGIPFRWNNISADQKLLLESEEDVLEYIRGKNNIPTFRTRLNNDLVTENILGDIVHSSPVIYSPPGSDESTIFIGANDGMLHAFNANTGVERFAYIPTLVYKDEDDNSNKLAGLKETTFLHKFFVDATPAVWPNVNGETLLVGGLGKGGKGYYALDVTNVHTYDSTSEADIASAVVKWEYPAPGATDPDMGYSYSKPFIVKSNYNNGGWVVIFGNGYNSTNGHAVLYILDADTGVEIATLDTGAGSDNGLSTPALIDLDNDYRVDVVYAGDLKGNLWKFDLTNSNTGSWDVAFSSGSALFQATGLGPNPQPITTKPAVMKHPLRHGLMVLFGTGKFLGESDRIDTDTQTLYGIWDFSDDTDTSLGTFQRPGLSYLPGIELLEQETVFQDNFLGNQSIVETFGEEGIHGISEHLLRITSDFTANWAVNDETPFPDPDPGAAEQAHAGWYYDLPILGERLIEDPLIREGIFIAVTTIPDSSYCSGGGWSIVNEFDALDGSRPASPTFDVTGSSDGTILINESDKINLTALTGETGDDNETIWVASTGILKPGGGILHLSESSIVELPGEAPKREKKILSSSIGKIQEVVELAPRRGIAFWREH